MKAGWIAAILTLTVAAACLVGPLRDAEASTRPRYGGAATVVWTEPMSVSDPSNNLLPSERAFSALLFETLFEPSQNGPRPLLAEAWSANDDSTEWIVNLKRGVRFHNGVTLTANDVVYSFQRVLESPDTCPYKWPLRKLLAVTPVTDVNPDGDPGSANTGDGSSQTSDQQPDGRSPVAGGRPGITGGRHESRHFAVLFSFSEPEPDLPRLLSCPGLVVLPFSSSQYEPDSGILPGTPPGTGPFKLGRSQPPTRFNLNANEDHHLGRPFLDSVTWTFTPFDEGLVEFQAGTAILLAGIPSPVTGELASLPAGTKRMVSESSYMIYLGCNPSHSSLRSSNSRRAVFEAVDRSSILTSIVGPGGRVARSLLPDSNARIPFWGTTGADAEAPPRDAGRYAAERGGSHQTGAPASPNNAGTGETAGSMPGQDIDISHPRDLTLLVPRWHDLIAEIGDRIQVDLMAAGHGVRLRKVGREEFASKLAGGDFDLFVGLWAPDRWSDDGAWLLNNFLRTQLEPVGVLENALSSLDTVHLEGFEETLSEEALLLPLFHMDLVVYLRNRLVTADAGAGGIPHLAWSWLRTGGR